MDRTGANFFKVYEQLKTRLRANLVPIVLPIGAADTFKGVIDLVKMKAIVWDEASQGTTFEYIDIPAELEGVANERSEEHTSEIQSLMRISYAVFSLKNK